MKKKTDAVASPKSTRSNSANNFIGDEGTSDIKIPHIPINGRNFEALNFNE